MKLKVLILLMVLKVVELTESNSNLRINSLLFKMFILIKVPF